jgi:hypothetical protein
MAYVFASDGAGAYTETKLAPRGSRGVTSVGEAVAIADGIVVVGAPQPGTGYGVGVAYVFTSDAAGRFTETKLTPSDGATAGWFGNRDCQFR